MNALSKMLLVLLLLALAGAGGYFLSRAFVEPASEPVLVGQAPVPAAPTGLAASRRQPVLVGGQGVEQAPAAIESRWGRLNREAIALLDEERLEEAIEQFELCCAGMPSRASVGACGTLNEERPGAWSSDSSGCRSGPTADRRAFWGTRMGCGRLVARCGSVMPSSP